MSLLTTALELVAYAGATYIQNMAFTASSRSRNSGDPNYHRKAALASNSIYYFCNLIITLYIVQWAHKPLMLILAGIVYTVSTTEGSVLMMRILLKKESGKRQVGAR